MLSSLLQMMERLLEQIKLENPPLNEISLKSRLGNSEILFQIAPHPRPKLRLFNSLASRTTMSRHTS
jgi:hypothetical protein